MVIKLKRMTGEEFIRKILEGERRFLKINLEDGFDLSGHEAFLELQEYLKQQDLEENPIKIFESDFRRITATGLYLPSVKATDTNFEEANFRGADFYRADLCRVNLKHGDLSEADLRSACIMNADLYEANLEKANLVNTNLGNTNFGAANLQKANLSFALLKYTCFNGADLKRANLEYATLGEARFERADLRQAKFGNADLRKTDFDWADLRGVEGLEETKNLETAIFTEKTKVTPTEKAIIEEAWSRRRLTVVEELF